MQKASPKKKRQPLEGSKRQELIRQIGEDALQEVIASLPKRLLREATRKAAKSPIQATNHGKPKHFSKEERKRRAGQMKLIQRKRWEPKPEAKP